MSHPVDRLLPVTWLFPHLGTKSPFAEIRFLPVTRDGVQVWCFRAVTYTEPRELIGYRDTLEDIAQLCHAYAVAASVRPELNDMTRNDGM